MKKLTLLFIVVIALLNTTFAQKEIPQNDDSNQNIERNIFSRKTLGGLSYSSQSSDFEKFSFPVIKNPIKYHNIELIAHLQKIYQIKDTVTQFSYLKKQSIKLYYGYGIQDKEVGGPDDPTGESIDFLKMNFGADYVRGYGWDITDDMGLVLSNDYGLGLDILAHSDFLSDTIDKNGLYFTDINSINLEFMPIKNLSIQLDYANIIMYDNINVPYWGLSKVIQTGGNVVIDIFMTQKLLDKQDGMTPIYNAAAQFAWNYLFYKIKKSDTFFPLPNDENEKGFQTDGFKISVSFSLGGSSTSLF